MLSVMGDSWGNTRHHALSKSDFSVLDPPPAHLVSAFPCCPVDADCPAPPAPAVGHDPAGLLGAEAAGAATRTVIRIGLAPDPSFEVQLSVGDLSNARAYGLEEIVPPGAWVGAISHGGVFNEAEGHIRWIFLDNEPRTVTYEVAVLDGDLTAESFEGRLSIDGRSQPIRSAGIRLTPSADADGDGDVDLADYIALLGCLGGADEPPAPGCESSDLDGDNDVDLADVLVFEAQFTGVR